MAKSKSHIMDAVLVGSIEWATARRAAIGMAAKLQCEVDGLNMQGKDAYSPMAWLNICRHLRVVTDGMTVMRLLAEGKSNAQITEATGIPVGSIAAYKAWNTMYAEALMAGVKRHITLKGRNDAERQADADFFRSCDIAIDVQQEASNG
jgi:hypothetical protein